MPLPVHIICCDSIARDAATEQISYIKIVDLIKTRRVTVTPEQPVPPPGRIIDLHIAAKWMREESDAPDTVFEVTTTLKADGAPDFALPTAEIEFKTPFHLVISQVQFHGLPIINGFLYAECSLRPRGGTEWITQRYPILVQEEPGQNPTAAAT